MNTPTTLGIDISKKHFDVALLRNNKFKHKKFTNNAKGFTSLLDWLSRHDAQNIHACLEATGVYGEALSEFLFDHQILVSVVNPSRVKGFAQSEQLRSKTDKVDAGLIARFCLALTPGLWQPMPLKIRELRDLVRRLDALNEMRQQERNRLEGASSTIAEQLNKHIAYLDDEIHIVKTLIRDHIDKHPDLKRNKALLESIPGVGEATINVVLSEFWSTTQFRSAKALAAFVGVAPSVRESGTSLRARGSMSKMGRSKLRNAFFMPALVALRYNPDIVAMKERLTKAGKPKVVIVGAAMRKLIHIVYGVLKNQRPFEANYA
jgi:transposase